MASGDTKTEAMLNVLGNGGSGDEFRGCCNTKTQSYILDAIDRINNLDPSGGGGDFTTLKDSDANYSFDGTDYIALWLLPSGKYKLDEDATVELLPHLVEDAPTDTVSSESNPVAIITNEEESGGSADVLLLSSQSSFYTNVDYDTGVSNNFNFMNVEFSGTDGQSDGSAGLVPAPATTDADKFLKSDGTWATAGGGGGTTVVQTTGISTTDVMSQDAVTKRMYPRFGVYNDAIGIIGANENQDSSAGAMSIGIGSGHIARSDNAVAIGPQATIYAAGVYSTAIGSSSKTEGHSRAVAIGNATNAAFDNSVAIGTNAKTTRVGEVNIGAGTSGRGYNSTNYRVIGGVHDGQDAHDAVTVGQINTVIDAINSATGSNISHIGA